MAGLGTRTAWFAFAAFWLLLVAAVLGCGSGSGQSSAGGTVVSETPTLDTVKIPNWIICGTYPSVDEAGHPSEKPEYYILHAINRKLKYFPAFASEIGMKSVSTCDEARAFSRSYAKYFASHPYFDRDIPSEPVPKLPLELAAAQPATASVPKIYNGSPSGPDPGDTRNLFPVVNFSVVLEQGAKYHNGTPIPDAVNGSVRVRCSGTFIARNWILTAAHCFDTIALTYDPKVDQGWLTDWPDGWEINWPDEQGETTRSGSLVAKTLEHVRAWTFVNPNYTGLCGSGPPACASTPPPADWIYPAPTPKGGEGYDVALLWLPPRLYDGNLAAQPAVSSWAVQVGRIDDLLPGWNLSDYGYGPTAETPVGFPKPQPALTFGFPQQTFLPTVGHALNVTLGSDIASPSSGPSSLCSGDSGGPLVRTTVTPPTGQKVIVGVNSGASRDPFREGACSAVAGDVLQWSQVDTVFSWIALMMTLQNGPDYAPRLIADGNAPASYAQLWGTQCNTDCDCGLTEYCYNPVKGTDTQWGRTQNPVSCDVCGNGCDCMVGQCFPLPTAPEANGGLTTCGGVCTNTLTDSHNCGGCGTTCPTGLVCAGGQCM